MPMDRSYGLLPREPWPGSFIDKADGYSIWTRLYPRFVFSEPA
jgi:hypothetical protein